MDECFVICRPGGSESGLEIAATFTNKDLADRELDRLNAFRQPGAPEWHMLIRPIA
jgi:hypothetical protein